MSSRRLIERPGNVTPTLTDTLRTAIESYLITLNTAIPGKIVSYDPSLQSATVQPLFKRTFTSGSVVDLPQITNVPVQFPRTASSHIHLPLSGGDPCLLIFAQRSLDPWKQSGGCVDPDDDRRHDLSDAIAIPGVSAFNNPFEVSDPEAITIKNGDTEIIVKDDGTFQFTNGNEELVSIAVELIDLIIAAQTNTVLGPQPFVNLADFISLKTRLETLQGGG